MITLTFDFPTPEIEQQAIDELAEHFGYPLEVMIEVEVERPVILMDGTESTGISHEQQAIPNPQSKLDFGKRKVADMLGAIIRARILAKTTANADAQIHAALAATQIS